MKDVGREVGEGPLPDEPSLARFFTATASAMDRENVLIIKPPACPATVPVQIKRGDQRDFHHITEGQFKRRNKLPTAVARRFDVWENFVGEEVRIIPLREDGRIIHTVHGWGEVQPLADERSADDEGSPQTVRVVFADGRTQRYLLDEEKQVATAPVSSTSSDDDEATILLAAYLEVGVDEFVLRTDGRDRENTRSDDERLERELKRSVRDGYVRTEDGRRVEPDHPESPLRKAGLI